LVEAASKRNIPVHAIPGASAVLSALVSSGLPAHQFFFLGFLPEKGGKRMELLREIKQTSVSTKTLNPTYILYASPYKLKGDLKTLLAVFGNIDIVVSRELTKLYEHVWHGSIESAQKEFADPKGEFVICFHLPH
jgi:16S rRNA (cytidine1402-2'-O)-methyltransferase